MEINDQSVRVSRDEFQYLKWFRCNADFGPAHSDVVHYMHEQFKQETGKQIPEGWGDGDN